MPERKRRAYSPPRFICGEEAPYGGRSAARKYSRAELGRWGACNRAVKAEGERCYQHRPTWAKPWSRETPLRAPRYAELVMEFNRAEDVHERYTLSSLVAWHVPVPWRHWTQFWMNHTAGAGSSDPS